MHDFPADCLIITSIDPILRNINQKSRRKHEKEQSFDQGFGGHPVYRDAHPHGGHRGRRRNRQRAPGHHQRQHGGNDAAHAGHEQGVHEPAGKIEQRRIRKQAHVIPQGQDPRPQVGRKRALFAPEGGQKKPEHRDHPQDGKHGEQGVQGNGDAQLAQIFSARYLEFVPENTIKGAFSLIL